MKRWTPARPTIFEADDNGKWCRCIDVAPLEQFKTWAEVQLAADGEVIQKLEKRIGELLADVSHLEAELFAVDATLARRDRLDDCPNRLSKIQKMCSENGRLESENKQLKEEVKVFYRGITG